MTVSAVRDRAGEPRSKDHAEGIETVRQAYYERISAFDLAPLWEVLRNLVPPQPTSVCAPGIWHFKDLKPLVGTPACLHAHVGFLAHGSLAFEYADGCRVDVTAPAVVNIAPGHDAWVVGDERAVLIEVDYQGDTVARVGVEAEHHH